MNLKRSVQAIKGFTLIELAVVLVIVGIVLGSFIGTLTSRINATKKSDVLEELEEIKQSMMAYAFVNGYLPCPDCDAAGGDCAAGRAGGAYHAAERLAAAGRRPHLRLRGTLDRRRHRRDLLLRLRGMVTEREA